MKNNFISHSHESARIYRNHYKPSFNLFKLLFSFLGVLISGQSPAARNRMSKIKG